MAIGSTVTVVINAAARTGAAFNRLRNDLRQAAANARAAANRMTNSFIHRGGIPGVLGPHLRRAGNMLRGFGRSAASAVQTGFRQISSVIQGGFDALPPKAKAIVAGAGIALGLALATYIGATLNAALLGAVGGGVLAVGIKKAAQDPRVKDAFGSLNKIIQGDLTDSAKVFLAPLERAAARFKEVWRDAVGPGVREAFSDLAPVVDKLSTGISKFFRNVMPGFNKAVKAAGPILSAVAGELDDLGISLSNALESMAKGEDGAIKGAITTFKVLGAVIEQVGHILGGAAIAYDAATKAAEKFRNVAPLGGLGFAWLADQLAEVNETAEEGFTDFLPQYARGVVLAAEASESAARAVQQLEDDLRSLFDTMTGETDAALRYEEAIDALTKTVQENGRATDIGTEKGRENIKAVEEVARAAYAARDAAIAMAGGQNASKDAVDAANRQFSAQIGALRGMLQQMGFTEAQIDDLISKWEALALKADISKQITITIRQRTIGGNLYNASQLAGEYSSGIGGRAHGGLATGVVMAGEHGPELIDVGASGARVTNHKQTEQMLASAGSGKPPVVIIQPGGSDTKLMNVLMAGLRAVIASDYSGDVQAALGRG